MSVSVMADVWKHSQHGGSKLLMLLAIADFADDDGVAFPSTAVLAEKIRMSEPSVKRLRRELYDSGELEYVKGGNFRGDPLYVRVAIKGIKTIPLPEKKGIKTIPLLEERVSPEIPINDGRVSNGAQKGIKSRALRVSPVIPDPSLDPSLDPPEEGDAREWQPSLGAMPAPTPSPNRKRGRVTSKDIDPRKIGPDDLIDEGEGSTPLEVWREYAKYSPTDAQIREARKIEDLDAWRAHVKECVVRRGFRGFGNVLDTWANGFQKQAGGSFSNGFGTNGGPIHDNPDGANGNGRAPEKLERPTAFPELWWQRANDYQRKGIVAQPDEWSGWIEIIAGA